MWYGLSLLIRQIRNRICRFRISRYCPICLNVWSVSSLWRIEENDPFPDLQSAYRSNHSTETAVLKVLSDILIALDSDKLALLSLLDLSAAFDSVDHDTLLQRLRTSYGLGGNVVAWFASYLTKLKQYVRTAVSQSAVLFGVPQRSVLEPILFLLYVADLLQLVKRHGLHPHCYTEDTQICGISDLSHVDALQKRLSVCIDEVFSRMISNRLQLNPAKTEVLCCLSARRHHQIPTGPACVGDTSVLLVRTVRDFGVFIDADVTLSAHVTAIVKACFAALRQIRSARRLLSRTTLLTLVYALVVTKVDYCSSVPSGISGQLLQWPQSVFNAAARLVFSARKSDHIALLLCELYTGWKFRREFSSGYVFSHIVALTARRHHTSLRPSTWLPTASSECFNVDAGCTVHKTHHAGWSNLPGGCCSRMECSSAVFSSCAIAAAVPPRPEDVTVPVIVLFTTVSSCDRL